MSLASKLRSAGLNFKETESGLLGGVFRFGDDRSQVFMLDPNADDLKGYREHDFVSPIGPADDAANVRRACELAGGKKRGAIVVRGGVILLKVEIPEDLDGPTAMDQVAAVCFMADEMEKEIFGTDRV